MSAPPAESLVSQGARWAWIPLLVLALVLSIWLHGLRQRNEAARGALRTLDKQSAALLARLSTDTEQTDSEPHLVSSAPTKSIAKPTAVPGALQSFSDTNVMGDPELGPAVVRRHRRYAMGNYRQAIEAMHLSPADEAKLRTLIVDRWNAAMDARDIVDRMPNAPGGLRNQAIEAAQQAGDRAIKEFLGDEAYAQFQAASQVFVARTSNWMLFTALWDAGMPATDDQKNAYAQALQQVNMQFPTADSRGAADPQTGLTRADITLLNSLRSVVSPEQLALIRDQRIRDARFAMLERAKRALAEKH